MTKQALIELRDKVAAGNLNSTELGVLHGCMSLKGYWINDLEFNRDQKRQIFLAYNGSLDAAVAFLEAVLSTFAINRISTWPNANARAEIWGTHVDNCERWHHHSDGRFKAEAETPARALLLATLDALIERDE